MALFQSERFPVAARIPELDRVIVAPGGDYPAIRRKGYVVQHVFMPLKGEKILAGRGVPDLCRPVPTGSGNVELLASRSAAVSADRVAVWSVRVR